jgi:hypothetical protein
MGIKQSSCTDARGFQTKRNIVTQSSAAFANLRGCVCRHLSAFASAALLHNNLSTLRYDPDATRE